MGAIGEGSRDRGRHPWVFGTGGSGLRLGRLENWELGNRRFGAALDWDSLSLARAYCIYCIRTFATTVAAFADGALRGAQCLDGGWAVGAAVWTGTLRLRRMLLDSGNLLTWVLLDQCQRLRLSPSHDHLARALLTSAALFFGYESRAISRIVPCSLVAYFVGVDYTPLIARVLL